VRPGTYRLRITVAGKTMTVKAKVRGGLRPSAIKT
jgi:hypothetical protein